MRWKIYYSPYTNISRNKYKYKCMKFVKASLSVCVRVASNTILNEWVINELQQQWPTTPACIPLLRLNDRKVGMNNEMQNAGRHGRVSLIVSMQRDSRRKREGSMCEEGCQPVNIDSFAIHLNPSTLTLFILCIVCLMLLLLLLLLFITTFQ